MTPERLIKQLGLQPHPEGGHYREIFRSSVLVDEKRAASTSIYYLLQAGEVSHWHRIDADECWHHYEGRGGFCRGAERCLAVRKNHG